MAEVVVSLQPALRSELKEPMGKIYTNEDALLADASGWIVSVGDMVTFHLLGAGTRPTVALIDRQTERSAVDPGVTRTFTGFDFEIDVDNPPATLTVPLLEALATAIERTDEETLIEVDGEEDLATLPAILLAPDGTSVVYGQPGEGMVLVNVDEQARERARQILTRMEGDTDRLWSLLDN